MPFYTQGLPGMPGVDGTPGAVGAPGPQGNKVSAYYLPTSCTYTGSTALHLIFSSMYNLLWTQKRLRS